MTRRTRLIIVLVLNLALVAGLLVAGLAAHSLAVLAAAGDCLADAAAIGVSLLAIALSRRGPSARHPAGYPRATAYAALVNATLLLGVVIAVIAEGITRLSTGTGPVRGLPVLVASGVAALAMLTGGLIASADEDDENDSEGDRANMRAVVLDTLADSASAAGVAVTGAVILAEPGLAWLDPAVALVISAVVGYHALKLIRDVIGSLRRSAPHPSPHGSEAAQTSPSPAPPPPPGRAR